MAAHPALQMVAPAARLDGRLRPLARLHAVLRTPPPPLHQVPSHRRTLLGRRCIRRRSPRLLHSARRETHGLLPILLPRRRRGLARGSITGKLVGILPVTAAPGGTAK